MFHVNHFLRRHSGGSVLLCLLLVLTTLPLHAAAGELDPTFDSGGKLITHLRTGDGAIFAMALQADGKLVVARDFGVAQWLTRQHL